MNRSRDYDSMHDSRCYAKLYKSELPQNLGYELHHDEVATHQLAQGLLIVSKWMAEIQVQIWKKTLV